MKIKEILIFHLKAPLQKPIIWSNGYINHRSTLLVKINTSSGISGWGETTDINAAPIIQNISSLLVGRNATERKCLWQFMFSLFYNSNCNYGVVTRAISAIDIALWDITGRMLNEPIYNLLGGKVRTSIAVYASGMYMTASNYMKNTYIEAESFVEAEFQSMKMKIGALEISEDCERIKGVRNVIGKDIRLMIDANQAYDVLSATKMALAVEKENIHWFEEPLPANNINGYASLKQKTFIPLAVGENFSSAYEFNDFFVRQCIDISQPDVGNIGGFTEISKVINLSHIFRINISPHAWGSPLLLAATLHCCATITPVSCSSTPLPYIQEPVLEYDCTENPFKSILCGSQITPEKSYLKIPDEAGLGVNVDEIIIQQFIKKKWIVDHH